MTRQQVEFLPAQHSGVGSFWDPAQGDIVHQCSVESPSW
jgi:hypothetical protein